MLQTGKNVQFHCLKRYQTALKTVQTVPSSYFSVSSDTVSDIETVEFSLSGASLPGPAALPERAPAGFRVLHGRGAGGSGRRGPRVRRQSTQIGKATDPVFWSPLYHIISWLFKSFQRFRTSNVWIKMRFDIGVSHRGFPVCVDCGKQRDGKRGEVVW